MRQHVFEKYNYVQYSKYKMSTVNNLWQIANRDDLLNYLTTNKKK